MIEKMEQKNLLGGRLLFTHQMLAEYVRDQKDLPLTIVFNAQKPSLHYFIDEMHYGAVPIQSRKMKTNIKKYWANNNTIFIAIICILAIVILFSCE